MKTIIFYLFLLFLPLTCLARDLKGLVLDETTMEPVAGVNIFLSGTMIGGTTDNSGKYSITVRNIVYTQLIVSYVGYEIVVIDNPFEFLPDTIFLKEKDFMLEEVVVTGKSTFSEEQKWRAFREQFLGMTEAGHSCIILNEGDIRLGYDPETRKLHAYSDEIIVIENKYLGYKINWSFEAFFIKLGFKKSLSPENVDSVSIAGMAYFEDLHPNEELYSKRRNDTYLLSKNRFFKLLTESNIKDSDITLTRNVQVDKPLSQEKFFTITEEQTDESIHNVIINPEVQDRNGTTAIRVYIRKKYSNRSSIAMNPLAKMSLRVNDYLSIFFFSTDFFNVDLYGNTNLSNEQFIVSGEIANNRIGDQLPFDYLPPDK